MYFEEECFEIVSVLNENESFLFSDGSFLTLTPLFWVGVTKL